MERNTELVNENESNIKFTVGAEMPVPSHPITVVIENTMDIAQEARILFHNATKDDNYGNPHGINIMQAIGQFKDDGTISQNYEGLLSDLRGRVLGVGATAVSCNNSDSNFLKSDIWVRSLKMAGDGSESTYHNFPIQFTSPSGGFAVNQNIAFDLDNTEGYLSGFICTIPANEKVSVMLYTKTNTPLSTNK